MHITGRWRIAALTFLALYLELVCIRWLGAEMKLFAYFKNFVLMASFAGLGLGCAYPVRREPKWKWLPWGILLLVVLCSTTTESGLALAFFPDAGVFQWNGSLASPDLRAQFEELLPMLPNGQSATAFFIEVTVALLALIYGILSLIVMCFFSIGRSLAFAFDRERPLAAYTADIAGSLAGTLVAAAVAWIEAPPVVWIAIVGLTIIALDRGRRLVTATALGLAVAVAAYQYLGHPELVWSPYYQIEVKPSVVVTVDGAEKTTGWAIDVNHSAFQMFEDLSPAAMGMYQRQLPTETRDFLEGARQRHELPFRLHTNLERTLVIGAGAGNDVAAALRLGAGHIDAVDIDPAILNIGRTMHPEQPYQSDRVRVITADARAFIEGTPEKYDLIVFGTLDSQTAVSAQSSLRLEYFVYSEESFRKVSTLLKPNGLLVVAFGTGWRPWVTERMAATVSLGTGSPIRVLTLKSEEGRTFFVGGPAAAAIDWPAVTAALGLVDATASYAHTTIRPSTDDWPYLYMDPQRFPWVLAGCVTLNVLLAISWLRRLSRRREPSDPAERAFVWQMFLMGAGFLLLETKGLTELALIFGGTWIVNAIVFSGLFAFILVATLWVQRRPGFDARVPFV